MHRIVQGLGSYSEAVENGEDKGRALERAFAASSRAMLAFTIHQQTDQTKVSGINFANRRLE